MELSDKIVKPSFDGRFSLIDKFIVLTLTFNTRVTNGLYKTGPDWRIFPLIFPKVDFTPI
jgi:hypothetical protein